MAKSESNIFKELREVKTAAATAALIPQFAQERMLTQQKFDALENSREDAILSGPSAREKLRAEVEEVKGYLDDLDAASRVAERLYREFKTKEDGAAVEHRMAEARETNKLLREDYLEIHKLASALGDRLRQAKARSIAIQNANAFAAEAKRPELRILPVLSVLAKHLGVTTEMVSTGGGNFVHDPIKEFVLPEYYPLESMKFGKRLASLKDVEV